MIKDKQINIRLTKTEYETLKINAQILGLSSPTTYAREKITKDHIVKPKMPFDDIKYIRTELKRCGNNINQIAHLCNQNDAFYLSQINEITSIRKELKILSQQLK